MSHKTRLKENTMWLYWKIERQLEDINLQLKLAEERCIEAGLTLKGLPLPTKTKRCNRNRKKRTINKRELAIKAAQEEKMQALENVKKVKRWLEVRRMKIESQIDKKIYSIINKGGQCLTK